MAESIKSQKKLSALQPKIEAARQKFKNDRERQAREIITIYQQEKINPFGGLLPILIQLPILFALYQVFSKGLQAEEMVNLYSFVSRPPIINSTFLGLINLSFPNTILAVLAGLIQFFQSKMTTPTTQKQKDTVSQFSNILQKQMLFLLPLLTLLFLLRLPAAFSLYWIATSLFSIFQQCLIFKESHA
jgi:YidC/Oxa1 family membrane protein insertase